LGVEVFFVISGFVIPYSLQHKGYKVRQFGRFICKRIVRLDPPYVTVVFLILLLDQLAMLVPGFQGTTGSPSLFRVLLHFGYLNAFFGYEWLNPVFWTLAIEFQYYLMIGLIFPLIVARSHCKRFGLILGLLLLSVGITNSSLIFHYLSLFCLGMLALQFKQKLIGPTIYVLASVCATTVAWLTLGMMPALVGVVAAGIIAVGLEFKGSLFVFLASISYSLYLLHVPIGGRLINLGTRFAETELERDGVLFVALATSIGASYLLMRLIERPAQDWSARIAYDSRRRSASLARSFDVKTQPARADV
jgi:peptidoglycan/LPS O-acetylase OafA/YrhL